jgi:hypothetical protein
MIERVIRIANTFAEADAFDRADIAALSLEERISGVERLRRVWFGEDRAQSRLERVLVCADRPSSSLRDDRRPRRRRTRRASVDRGPRRVRRANAGKRAAPLFVIGRGALIKNKRAAGRAKDLVDVAQLEALPPPARPRASPRGKRRTRSRSR